MQLLLGWGDQRSSVTEIRICSWIFVCRSDSSEFQIGKVWYQLAIAFCFFRPFQSFLGLFSVYKLQRRSQSSFISLHYHAWIFLHICACIFWWDSSVRYQQWSGQRMLFCERNKVRTTRKVRNTTLNRVTEMQRNIWKPRLVLCSVISALNSQVNFFIFEFHSSCSCLPG